MQLVTPGTAGEFEGECGTNGLNPCVGLAVSKGPGDFSQWFIAHIQSDAKVPQRSGPCYDAVRRFTAQTARDLRPPVEGATVYIVTNASDFSSRAIRDGLVETYGNAAHLSDYGGFYVDPAGAIEPLTGEKNNIVGPQQFTVPPFTPTCPP